MIRLFRIFLIGLCFFAATAHAADDTSLHDAAKEGNKSKVEALLAQGADVNARSKYGITPLQLAACSDINIDKLPLVKLLLAKGADVNAKDNLGTTPLHEAARCNGSKAIVALLLAQGADVNATNKNGDTPLHTAAEEAARIFKEQQKICNVYGDGDLMCKLLGNAIREHKDIAELLENHILKQATKQANPRAMFVQLTEKIKKEPNDNSARQLIIKLAQELKPAPAIPEEAEKFDGRAQYAFRAAKSEAEFLDAAREYLKAVEAAPWVADYYFNLCKILEKSNRPAEAARACKLYLAAAPQAADAGNVRKLVAGLEYALERERGSVTNRGDCINLPAGYEGGAKVARIGNQKLSLKLYSVLSGGVWRNELGIYDISTLPNNIIGQHFQLDPVDTTFQLEDRIAGTPYFRLTIARDGRITFGGHGSPQAEIMTSTTELHQLRNEQLKQCQLAVKDGNFFIALLQGGPLETNARVNGGILFASDCRGGLQGDKPGWFPAVLAPHPETPGITSADARMQDFSVAPANACQQTRKDNLGWLSQ